MSARVPDDDTLARTHAGLVAPIDEASGVTLPELDAFTD
jgi:hypothetical protein